MNVWHYSPPKRALKIAGVTCNEIRNEIRKIAGKAWVM
jgi:hypothetical protein